MYLLPNIFGIDRVGLLIFNLINHQIVNFQPFSDDDAEISL